MLAFLNVLALLFAVLAVVGAVYQIASAVLVGRFARRRAPVLADLPAVTLLKPLCGEEPELEAALRSFCTQDYPRYQIVFGVHEEGDRARLVAERLREEYPSVDIQVVVGKGRPDRGNPKVANLMDMLPAARHPVLILSDSDMEVPPDYIRASLSTLDEPRVGAATCLYVGRPRAGLWSRLGAMGINHGFLPSVLLARAIGRRDGCFGASIAIRAETLGKIGGLAPLRERLADDYLLGAAVREKGMELGLVPCLPRSVVFEPDFSSLFAHEVRWGRTLASIDGVGYVASMITLAIPMALIGLALSWGGSAACVALLFAVFGRILAVRMEEQALGLERQALLLVLFRDIFSLAVQVVALSGRTVRWRGQDFRIGAKGALVPLGESSQP